MSTKEVTAFRALNVRERMALVADWLDWNEETMSFGLRSVDDAVKLYEYGLLHNNNNKVDEMADRWHPASFRAAIGYDPLSQEAQA